MKYIKTVFAILGLLLVILVCAIGFAGFTQTGTRLALNIALPLINSDNLKISVEEPGALLSGDLTAKRVAIADADDTWLEIKDLKAAWSPADLLKATFRVNALSAGAVNLDRLPESDSSSNGSSSGSLPVALDIRNISLPQIALGESFSGKEEQLALKGDLSLDSDRATANLKLTDLNRGDAEIETALNYDVTTNTLALDLTANEAKGGFVSSLLQLPGNPALSINVKGNGPLNNWTGEAHGSLEGMEVVSFNAQYSQPESGKNIIALKGGGALDALLPPALGPLFEGNTDVDVDAEIGTDGTIKVQKGIVTTGALSAHVSGTYSPEGQNDLKAEISALDGSADFNFLNEDGGWRALLKSANIAISGPADASQITVNAALDKLQIKDGEISGIALNAASESFDLKNRKGSIAATLTADASQFSDENLDRLVQAPLELDLPLTMDGDQLTVENAKLQSASIGGTFGARYDLGTNTGNADFKLFAAPSVLPPTLATGVTETTKLEGKAEIGDGNYSLPEFEIESQLLTATGNASLNDGAISAELSGKIPDLSLWRPDLEGEAELAGEASGSLEQPKASVELSIAKATVSGQELLDLSVSLSGEIGDSGPVASVRLEGVLGGQTIEVGADLQTADNGGYAIPDITAEAGSNRIQGSLTLTKDFQPDGQFTFDLPDIALLGAIAGQKLDGNIKGTAKIALENGELVSRIDAEGDKLSAASADIEKPKVHISTQGALISGEIETASIASGDNKIEKPTLTFDRNGDDVSFKFSGRYDNADAKANGSINTAGPTRIQLDLLDVKPRGIPIKLKKPAVISVVDGSANIESAALALGSGSLDISGSAGEKLALSAKLSAIPASLANTFSKDLGADGTLSGTIDVTGTASDPKVAYNLKLDGGSVAQMRSLGVGSFNIGANGTFADNKASLKLSGSNAGGLSIDGGGSIDLSSKTLSMNFSGPVPASLLNGVTASQGMAFSGTANGNISISGALSSPQINGSVVLNSVGADLVRQNISITGMTGEVQLKGQTASLVGIKGSFSNGGSYTASGTVSTNGTYPADLTINLDNVSYTDGNLVSAKLGGEVKVSGSLVANPKISGTINVSRANITVPETLPTSISAINLKHKNAPADVARQYAEISPSDTSDGNQAAALLDLTVNAPNQVFVRGRGMDAELGGTVNISGTTANPTVSGGFEMIRGRLSLLGKRLDFTSGKIGFAGGLIPDLDLSATSTAGSTTVIINVDGEANDPQFSFTSSPSLPEDEVLAQLVFQQSTSSLSPFQIAQLADAVAQLTGARTGSVFSKLRQAGGLDNLDVTSDDDGNAEVSAGKYLNSKTYLEVQQNTGTGTGKAIINLDVGKGLKLRGEADSDGEGAAGIFYEKEY